MFASKMSLLKPIIESKDGQHLTIYLKNEKNIFQLKKQLRESLDIAYEYLAPTLNTDTLVKFMSPIHGLLEDNKLLKSLNDNVGIFRNQNSFRIINLPVMVEQTCVVAKSFHVKPLLRWIQTDRDFIYLSIQEGYASLYHGNQTQFKLMDSIVLPEIYPDLKKNNISKIKKETMLNKNYVQTFDLIDRWLVENVRKESPLLFIAGPDDLSSQFAHYSRYQNIFKNKIWTQQTSVDLSAEICDEIRQYLMIIAQKELENTLLEFYQAEDLNLAHRNIYQITKAALKGKVRKLIIADGMYIFGKIDKSSGELAIHPTHLDHEDDDILDDLAQEVLSHGGEVLVASRHEIPKGRPILAILENEDRNLSKFKIQNLETFIKQFDWRNL